MFEDIFANPLQSPIVEFILRKIGGINLTEFFGVTLLFLLGYCILIPWKKHLRPKEIAGLLFPIGVGGTGIILFLFLVFSPQLLSFQNLAIIMALVCLTSLFFNFSKIKKWKFERPDAKTIFPNFMIWIKGFNAVQLLSFLFVLYVLFSISLKGIYWPIIDWDAITTFDFYGRTIAIEKSLVNTIVEEKAVGTGVAYPPLVHLLIAYSYLSGFFEPKIFFTLNYLSFALLFYAFSRRFVNRTGALIILLMIVLTPELSAFSAMVKTNVLQMMYCSTGVICFFIWRKERQISLLYLAAIMLGLNAWVRSEGIEFIAITGLFLMLELYHKKISWRHLVGFGVVSIIPFLSWQIYLSQTIELAQYQQVHVIKSLFWDSEKSGTILSYYLGHFTNLNYFSITFYAVLPFLFFNLIFYKKAKNHSIFLFVLLVMLLHFFLLYQISYRGNNMEFLLKHSLKRYIFNWVPLVYFFIGTSFAFQFGTKWLEDFLRFRFPKKSIAKKPE